MFRIVFLGSGDLACGVLQGLLSSDHEIVGVLPWERLSKCSLKTRLKRRLMTDTIALIEKHRLAQMTPCKANSPGFLKQLRELSPDILLVAGWGEILKAEVIGIPKVACVNVHPSLLPRHRGFNPISSVLCAGEQETGVTYHYLTTEIDAGDVLLQSAVPVAAHDNGDTLRRKVAFRAKETAAPALARVADPDFLPIKQDESLACYRPRLKPGDAKIDWSRPAQVLHDQIRGCYPWIRCHTAHRGKKLLVLRSEVTDLYHPARVPGEILYKSGTQLVVATGDSEKALLLSRIELDGAFGSIQGKLYLARHLQTGELLQ